MNIENMNLFKHVKHDYIHSYLIFLYDTMHNCKQMFDFTFF